jgi:hypothetical protein
VESQEPFITDYKQYWTPTEIEMMHFFQENIKSEYQYLIALPPETSFFLLFFHSYYGNWSSYFERNIQIAFFHYTEDLNQFIKEISINISFNVEIDKKIIIYSHIKPEKTLFPYFKDHYPIYFENNDVVIFIEE